METSAKTEFLQPITEAELPAVIDMYRREGPDYDHYTVEKFRWWYFDNPARSASLFGVNMDGRIEGFASTNNFWFLINGKKMLAAMIQNVITLEGIRGKGYFGKLLRRMEEDNREARGASIFTGFPNDMAAPIYITKAAYKWGHQLPVLATPASLFGAKHYRVLPDGVAGISNFHGLQPDNAVFKDEAFYRWRYAFYEEGVIRVLEIKRKGSLAGYAILRHFKKKGVPVWLLMDLIYYRPEDLPHIFGQIRLFAGRTAHLAVLFVEAPIFADAAKGIFTYNTGKNIDFMWKGVDDTETEQLIGLKYNMFFGDMDFF